MGKGRWGKRVIYKAYRFNYKASERDKEGMGIYKEVE